MIEIDEATVYRNYGLQTFKEIDMTACVAAQYSSKNFMQKELVISSKISLKDLVDKNPKIYLICLYNPDEGR